MKLKSNSKLVEGLDTYSRIISDYNMNNNDYIQEVAKNGRVRHTPFREEDKRFAAYSKEVDEINGEFTKKLYAFLNATKISNEYTSFFYLCALIKLAYVYKDDYEHDPQYYVKLNDKSHFFYDILREKFITSPKQEYLSLFKIMDKDTAVESFDYIQEVVIKSEKQINPDYIYYCIDALLSDLKVNIGSFVNIAVESNLDIKVARCIEEYQHEYDVGTIKHQLKKV